MAQVSDFVLDNQGFSSFRTELNNILSAQNSNNSGTSRPSSATTGTIWLDTTNSGSNSLTLKFFDGSDDISLATIDTSANTVNWLDSTVSADLVNDTTPQLGGNLDTNSHNIAFDDAHGIIDENGNEQITFQTTSSAVNQIDVTNSATGNAPEISATGGDTNIDLKLTPKGSGKLNLDGIKFPNADGSADQVLKTDGSGNLSFANASGGGVSWQSVKTASFTAVAGEGYFVNTTSGAITMTLPSSPSLGDTVIVTDYTRTFQTNKLTINTNSSKFQSLTTSTVDYEIEGLTLELVYSDANEGWIPTLDDDSVSKDTYGLEYLIVAGGGSGSRNKGAGGGAGGLLTNYDGTPLQVTAGITLTCTVGAGGSGGTSASGNDGTDSTVSGTGFTTLTAIKGGAGNSGGGAGLGNDGGSGGGTGGEGNGGAGGSGTSGQGNDGGSGQGGAVACGGGGGGAGNAGVNGSGNAGGNGGNGASNEITASSVVYAGGGGGVTESNSPTQGSGGNGGGGGASKSSDAGDGSANLGAGGGSSHSAGNSGDGGSGVIILRMLTANYSGTVTGSPTVTTSGSETIVKFTGDGTIVT